MRKRRRAPHRMVADEAYGAKKKRAPHRKGTNKVYGAIYISSE
ncbi:hypothetical protein [Butyrivibrio sp. LB2008]|nr:hypothetical protein [Butyrivibrio sp. LB2008]